MSYVREGGWIARFSFHSAYILISSCRARFDPAISPWDFAQTFGTFYRTFSGSMIGSVGDVFFRSLERNTVSSVEVELFDFGFIRLSFWFHHTVIGFGRSIPAWDFLEFRWEFWEAPWNFQRWLSTISFLNS